MNAHKLMNISEKHLHVHVRVNTRGQIYSHTTTQVLAREHREHAQQIQNQLVILKYSRSREHWQSVSLLYITAVSLFRSDAVQFPLTTGKHMYLPFALEHREHLQQLVNQLVILECSRSREHFLFS